MKFLTLLQLRDMWIQLLSQLVDYPLANIADGGQIFAEAETDDPERQPSPYSNSPYPITHLAAIFPAQAR